MEWVVVDWGQFGFDGNIKESDGDQTSCGWNGLSGWKAFY